MNSRISNTLRTHRKRTGLTQSDVAKILGLGKRGADRILRWEKGYSLPNLKNLIKLSLLYGVVPEAFYPDLIKKFRKLLSKELKAKKASK